MSTIFIADIKSLIFHYFDIVLIGRTTLTCKGSYHNTWPLVSCIKVAPNIKVADLYETIFRDTGNQLRVVELPTVHDFARILEHLDASCTNLESLSIVESSIVGQKNADAPLRSLLSRLKKLKIRISQFNESSFLPRVAAIISLPGPPFRLTKLSIEFDPVNLRGRDTFLNIMKNFRKLECLTAPISPIEVDFIEQLCETCPSLTQIRKSRFDSMFEGNIMKFRETAAARLLKTRVGFNMTSAHYPSFMEMLFRTIRLDSRAFLDWIVKIGLKQPIQADAVVPLLSAASTDNDRMQQLLSTVESDTCPVLPRFQQLRVFLVENRRFWSSLVMTSDPSVLRQVVKILGSPSPSTYLDMLCALLQRGSGEDQDEEDATWNDFMRAFQDTCQFVPRELIDQKLNNRQELMGLFGSARHASSLRWLLQNVPDKVSRECLRYHINPNDTETVFQSYLTNGFDLADVVVDHFNDSSFFSFPNDTDGFIKVAGCCVGELDIDKFKYLVESTRMEDVSAEARGCVLWRIVYSLFDEDDDAALFLDYWKECLSSYPKPAPAMFHTSPADPFASFGAVLDLMSSDAATEAPTNLCKTIKKYLPNLTKELKSIPAEQIERYIYGIIAIACATAEEPTDNKFVVHKVFPSFSRAYRQKATDEEAGKSLCRLLWLSIKHHPSPPLSVVTALLPHCTEADFSSSKPHHRDLYRSQIAEALCADIGDMISLEDDCAFFTSLVKLLEAPQLNKTTTTHNLNLVDMILMDRYTISGVSELIRAVLKRGGMISQSETEEAGYNQEALEEYFEVLSQVNM